MLKSSILKSAIATLLLGSATLASAGPGLIADSVTLTGAANGSSIAIEIYSPGFGSLSSSATVGAGAEFDVCVYDPGASTCAGGLLIGVDIGAFSVLFTVAGATNAGDNFMLSLGDLDFDPSATITGVTPGSYTLDTAGTFSFTGPAFPGPDFIEFTGDDLGGGNIASSGELLPFEIATQAAVPEPGALALLGLALTGLGFSRRRIAS